jgi:hypothetical protein
MKLRLALAFEWNPIEHISRLLEPYKVHLLPTPLAPAPAGLPPEEEQDAFCFDRDPCTSVSGHLASRDRNRAATLPWLRGMVNGSDQGLVLNC